MSLKKKNNKNIALIQFGELFFAFLAPFQDLAFLYVLCHLLTGKNITLVTEMYPECVIASWDALILLLDAENIE